jgi:hypothetical protein
LIDELPPGLPMIVLFEERGVHVMKEVSATFDLLIAKMSFY